MAGTDHNTNPQLQTISQFCAENPGFKPGGIRHYIFTRGGPEKVPGVYRFGRKVLVCAAEFLQSVKDGETKVIAGRAK